MEKPDENGFVNIKWPSKNVPPGGIFHTKILEPSPARENFLKLLVEESKLTLEQRKKSPWSLRQEDNNNHQSDAPRRAISLVRPRTSRRRSLSVIKESGVLDVDKYRPLTRAEDRELLKQKLQEQMAWGENPQQQPPVKQLQELTISKVTLPTAKDVRNDVLTQIRERVEWLADMEALGQGAIHRQLIQDQIAERMRILDDLGVDSECSSLCSASGFSTTRSYEVNIRNPNKRFSSVSSNSSNKTVTSKRSSKTSKVKSSVKSSARMRQKQEENVTAYNTPELQYSPRRRC